jgi:hypothetical protein
MNIEKWSTCSVIGRLIDHLVDVLPPALLALVVCELAEFGRAELQRCDGAERLAHAFDQVRAWALKRGPAPQQSDVDADDTEAPWPNNRALAAVVLLTALRPSAARLVAEQVAFALADPSASQVLCDWLRAQVPFVGIAQMRFDRVTDGLCRTEELDCEIRESRLVRCMRRS